MLISANCYEHIVVGMGTIVVATGTVLLYAYGCLPL